MEDTELVGFKEGLSEAFLYTAHYMEMKGLIPLRFPCMVNYIKHNVYWSDCDTIVVYVRLESQTKDVEMHFDHNVFNISNHSKGGCDVSWV